MFAITLFLALPTYSEIGLLDSEIQPLIAQLEHANFRQRQAATTRLKSVNLVQRKRIFRFAAKTVLPETQARCVSVLLSNTTLEWIIQVSKFQLSDDEDLRRFARQLLRKGRLVERAEEIHLELFLDFCDSLYEDSWPGPLVFLQLGQYENAMEENDEWLKRIDEEVSLTKQLTRILILNGKTAKAKREAESSADLNKRLRRNLKADGLLIRLTRDGFAGSPKQLTDAYRAFIAQACECKRQKLIRLFATAARRIALRFPKLRLRVAAGDRLIQIADHLVLRDELKNASIDQYYEEKLDRWLWSAINTRHVIVDLDGNEQKVAGIKSPRKIVEEMAQTILHRAYQELDDRRFDNAIQLTTAAKKLPARYTAIFSLTPEFLFHQITKKRSQPPEPKQSKAKPPQISPIKKRVHHYMDLARQAADQGDYQEAIRCVSVASVLAEGAKFDLFEDRPVQMLQRLRKEQANQ